MTLSPATGRRERREVVRRDRDGSGPTTAERPPARFPGAGARFALFGEVLMVGLLIALVGVLVVTLPIALAAGIRHLRRYVAAEDSRLTLFWADVRAGIAGGAAVGAISVVLALALLLDVAVASSGALPGGQAIAVVGWAGLTALATAVVLAATAWTPETGWRRAVSAIPAFVRTDAGGALYLAIAAGFVALVTWMLPPLLIAGLGCVALAAVAVPARRRRAHRAARIGTDAS